jgi:hypothetical protein
LGSAHPTLATLATLAAPLMSGESLGLVSADTTSGQYRFTEDSTRASTINVKPRSLTEVGMAQISSSEASFLQEGFGKVGITEIGIKEGSLQTIALSQVGFSQISLNEASGFQSSFTQIGITEVGSLEIGSSQVAATQIGISQDDSSQIFVSQANTLQINTTKVSLPSSVTLQQFLSSHNFNLQNTTIPTWTEFLTGTTPFNLNIEITDRPTTPLAEANITRFDPTAPPPTPTASAGSNALSRTLPERQHPLGKRRKLWPENCGQCPPYAPIDSDRAP